MYGYQVAHYCNEFTVMMLCRTPNWRMAGCNEQYHFHFNALNAEAFTYYTGKTTTHQDQQLANEVQMENTHMNPKNFPKGLCDKLYPDNNMQWTTLWSLIKKKAHYLEKYKRENHMVRLPFLLSMTFLKIPTNVIDECKKRHYFIGKKRKR